MSLTPPLAAIVPTDLPSVSEYPTRSESLLRDVIANTAEGRTFLEASTPAEALDKIWPGAISEPRPGPVHTLEELCGMRPFIVVSCAGMTWLRNAEHSPSWEGAPLISVLFEKEVPDTDAWNSPKHYWQFGDEISAVVRAILQSNELDVDRCEMAEPIARTAWEDRAEDGDYHQCRVNVRLGNRS